MARKSEDAPEGAKETKPAKARTDERGLPIVEPPTKEDSEGKVTPPLRRMG
jgi:hypothetical protein